MKIIEFQTLVWDYYRTNKRDMPWRQNTDPYWVFLSEIMLQQTQVSRVIPKFLAFTAQFPDTKSLSTATTQNLLLAWQGLGYNNRALRLREAATQIVEQYGDSFPNNVEEWDALPGIGPATAAAICTYAYNQAHVFIETNIRRVFLHHFFSHSYKIDDKELLPFIRDSVDKKNPREWYWALMDYGSFLKTQIPNPNRRSKHHSVQSKFEGSVRQVRGEILRRIVARPLTTESLFEEFGDRANQAINGLLKDKVIQQNETHLTLL